MLSINHILKLNIAKPGLPEHEGSIRTRTEKSDLEYNQKLM